MNTIVSIAVAMLPPTVNHMYLSAGRGRKRLAPAVDVFRALVLHAILNEYGQKPSVPVGPLELELWLVPADQRRFDVDNRIKAAQDALATALRFDDARINLVTAGRIEPSEHSGCVIVLRQASHRYTARQAEQGITHKNPYSLA